MNVHENAQGNCYNCNLVIVCTSLLQNTSDAMLHHEISINKVG